MRLRLHSRVELLTTAPGGVSRSEHVIGMRCIHPFVEQMQWSVTRLRGKSMYERLSGLMGVADRLMQARELCLHRRCRLSAAVALPHHVTVAPQLMGVQPLLHVSRRSLLISVCTHLALFISYFHSWLAELLRAPFPGDRTDYGISSELPFLHALVASVVSAMQPWRNCSPLTSLIASLISVTIELSSLAWRRVRWLVTTRY